MSGRRNVPYKAMQQQLWYGYKRTSARLHRTDPSAGCLGRSKAALFMAGQDRHIGVGGTVSGVDHDDGLKLVSGQWIES